jgi:uncharacterized protein YggE
MSLQSRLPGYLALIVLFATSMLPIALAADDGATVSGTGTSSIKRQPTKLRMSIVLTAKGKTLAEALDKLKARRELATAHLKKLQAEASTTKFGETALAAEGNAQQAQMQRMMRMARGGRGVPKALDVPASVSVNCTLTADWPLKYQTSDELLILSQQLQEKIKEADLCGLKEPKQLTPQEKELEEEQANGGGDEFDAYGQPQAKPGEPSFSFVAAITREERAAALAEAFTKAKAQAGQVAQAAGLKLGALVEVSGQSSEDYPDGIDPYTAYQLRQRGQHGLEGNQDEATSPVAGPVSATASIQAKFKAN